jgi:hypothetical protein
MPNAELYTQPTPRCTPHNKQTKRRRSIVRNMTQRAAGPVVAAAVTAAVTAAAAAVAVAVAAVAAVAAEPVAVVAAVPVVLRVSLTSSPTLMKPATLHADPLSRVRTARTSALVAASLSLCTKGHRTCAIDIEHRE